MGWFKDLFKDKELEARFTALDARLTELDKAKAAAEEQLAQAKEQLAQSSEELGIFRQKKAEDEARRNSKEPWVEIRSADYNENRGFRIELDWNDAFVGHLKETGIQGASDDEIVQKWLALLYQHLVEKLEAKVIEDKDQKGSVSDFV